jgi:hypothetical protein
VSNIKVVNQTFSFRDLFKYCYIKQTQIDSENILNELYPQISLKRKPTFEIIFNIYNLMVAELKSALKEKKEKVNNLENKITNIYEFLKDIKILDYSTYFQKKKELEYEIEEKNRKLKQIKQNNKHDKEINLKLEKEIVKLRNRIEEYEKKIYDQGLYINQLYLLRNQYKSELEKVEFLLEGAEVLDQFSFEICPSCLNEIPNKKSGCYLCGSESPSLSEEEIKAFRSEKRRLTLKYNKIKLYIEEQEKLLIEYRNEKDILEDTLYEKEQELNHITQIYISPLIKQVEQLNYEIGKLNNMIAQLDKTIEIINQYDYLNKDLENEIKLLKQLEKRIRELEKSQNDKSTIIKELSDLFYTILKAFKFPKLSDAYIKESDYLPYVRGNKYNDLGSLGAVTMINMAYFLAIGIKGSTSNYNHPGLLIFDSPRKNLGAESKEEEFKDEIIFNSIIKYFIKVDRDYGERLQLIVVNNGYPEFLDKSFVIKEFDGDGTKGLPYGLIDDIN